MSEIPDMSDAFEIEAPAKTNLWLKIIGKREDGFHELDTRMVALSLVDRLKLKWREDNDLVLRCSDESLPTGEENLVVKAVRALEKHTGKTFAISIDLTKHIPSGAGLGGGSSDAASVLLALNEMASLYLGEDELAEVGATIGSDISFFIYQRPCDCSGRGEIVEPIPDEMASMRILLIKPAFGIDTDWAYQRWAESEEYEGFLYEEQERTWGTMINHLERPVFEKYPILGEIKTWLLDQPEVDAALMSGSGSTTLAILHEDASEHELNTRAKERYGENTWTFLGRTV
jgi:4-diphosphocytidyl-2-C-methyl-D-erythritol kinase